MKNIRTLCVNMIDPGRFTMNFDYRFLRNESCTFEAEPRDKVTVECGNLGSYYIINTSVSNSEVRVQMEVENNIPANPDSFAYCSSNAAGYWQLDGYEKRNFEFLPIERGDICIKPNIDILEKKHVHRLDELSYDDIKKLASSLQAWPKELMSTISHLPFEHQIVRKQICIDSWKKVWQYTDMTLPAGSLMQIHSPSGHVTYNNKVNYVNAYGKDLRSGRYVKSGSDFKINGNSWAFFGSSKKNIFVNPNGPGYATGLTGESYDPSWDVCWLLDGSDEGFFEVIVNDNYYNDNHGSFCVTVTLRSGKSFFEYLLKPK